MHQLRGEFSMFSSVLLRQLQKCNDSFSRRYRALQLPHNHMEHVLCGVASVAEDLVDVLHPGCLQCLVTVLGCCS